VFKECSGRAILWSFCFEVSSGLDFLLLNLQPKSVKTKNEFKSNKWWLKDSYLNIIKFS